MDGPLLPIFIFCLMMGMGLTLTLSDFRRIAQVPGPVVTGTLLQLVVMPVFGVGLALAYDLSPLLAVGLVVCSACPGGMGSNVFVHMGRANIALSITLTATSTMVTLFTLPLWIRAIQAALGNAAGDVEVPILATALELGGFTVVPVAFGMLVRHVWPIALRLERPLTGVGILGLLAVLVYDSITRPDAPEQQFLESLAPVLWLVGLALVLGLGVPRLLGQSFSDGVTIATELCVRNTLLGMVVVTTSFGVLEPSIPLIAYSTAMSIPAVSITIFHRRRVTRQLARSESGVVPPD